MALAFTKMHGLGNDFVVVDCREGDPGGWPALAPRLAHRRLGVGCDQVLLIYPSAVADFRLDIYNADGSRAEMCGNGARCVARLVRDRGVGAEVLRWETLAGIVVTRHRGELVEVDLGAPELEGRRVPVNRDGPAREVPLALPNGASLAVTCVSMGNPHAVTFVADAEAYPVADIGPQVETHPFFPRRTNVEFVQVLNRNRLRMRVWERGAGLTAACGTGAAAAAVAGAWTGRTHRQVAVLLDGGPLEVCWDETTNRVSITGPAVTAFEGTWPG